MKGLPGLMLIAAACLGTQAAAGDFATYATYREISQKHEILAQLVAAEWPNLVFSSPLADAATLIAGAGGDGNSPSSALIRRGLHNAGLPEATAIAATVSTTEDGTNDVLDHLRSVVDASGRVTHVGLGRSASSRPPFRWQWTILLIERRIDLVDGVSSKSQPMSAFPLRFKPRPGWKDPRVLVQYPDGGTRRMRPVRRGAQWFTVVPVGHQPGILTVQILASNSVGTGVIAVMPIRIGMIDSETNDDRDAPALAHREIDEPGAAGHFMWQTIDTERTDHGLNRLKWDPRLAEVATRHSTDMLQNDFFGHLSPSHGDLRQRLSAASILASVSRENLALDQDLFSAHLSLMASPGHRSNILASEVTHIGIGAVRKISADGPPLWIITEIFVRKIPEN